MEYTQVSRIDAAVSYGVPGDTGRRRSSVRVYAEPGFARRQIVEDCEAAGLHVLGQGGLDELIDLSGGNMPGRLGDLLVIDCPTVDARTVAALSRLDMLTARKGACLVLSTSMNCLDEVFGCLDQCDAHILVQPSRAERMTVFSQLRMRVANTSVRETCPSDRLAIERLTQQMAFLTSNLAPAAAAYGNDGEPSIFDRHTHQGNEGDAKTRLADRAKLAPPDPALVRQIIKDRHRRAETFDGNLFADPAWDMLLDLTAAREEHRRVSVTSLCIASGVPATTALRWIAQLVEAGLFERVRDDSDKRRAYIALTDGAANAMARYFAKLRLPVAL